MGLVTLSLIWGASYLFIALALEELAPVVVGWVRVGGGSILILALVRYRQSSWPRDRASWAWLALIALFASAVPLAMIPWGQQHIDSGLAAVLIGAMPLWVALLAALVLPSEGMTALRAAGVLLGFAGVILVLGPDSVSLGLGGLQGQLAVLGASLCYAIGAVLVRLRPLPLDSTVVAGVQALLAFVWLTPLAIAEGVPNPLGLSAQTVMAVVMLALGSSGVGFLIYYWLLANVGATGTSMVTYLIPVTALGWGWWILDERIDALAIPGLLVILAGIMLVNRAGARRPVAVVDPAPQR
jgi:drug/metabolite transporter (DMT)-like permease